MIRILIINKSYSIFKALKHTLERQEDIEVSDYANCATSADQILEISHQEIDIVILEVNLGASEADGLVYAACLKQQFPKVKILMFSFFHSGFFVYKMFKEGIDGFLFKDSGPEEIVRAVRTLYEGGRYYTGQVKSVLDKYSGFLSVSNEDQLYISPVELKFIQRLRIDGQVMESPYDKIIWKNITYKLGTVDPDLILDIAYKNGWISY